MKGGGEKRTLVVVCYIIHPLYDLTELVDSLLALVNQALEFRMLITRLRWP